MTASSSRPCLVWLTGVPAAGKSTIAAEVVAWLRTAGYPAHLLDGDGFRATLSRDLGFSAADRSENIRRAGVVAGMLMDAGVTVVAAFVSPLRDDRDRLRDAFGDRFVEIFIDAPLPLVERRDPKGLYAAARARLIPDLSGFNGPYEEPLRPDIHVDAVHVDGRPADAAKIVVRFLVYRKGF